MFRSSVKNVKKIRYKEMGSKTGTGGIKCVLANRARALMVLDVV